MRLVDTDKTKGIRSKSQPFKSLIAILGERAEQSGEDIAFTFLLDGEERDDVLTYFGLATRVRDVGEQIRRQQAAGERALLIFEPGLDYVVAFYACLYAGIVAVPVYPPDPLRIDRTWNRLSIIARSARARMVLLSPTMKTILGAAERQLADVTLEVTAHLLPSAEHPPLTTERPTVGRTQGTSPSTCLHWDPYPVAPEDIALLQYTSGSTADPKGVMISHSNLLHNMQAIHDEFDADGVVGVSWLPPYHDLGLVGGILQPVYSGRHVVQMSPLAFIQKPVRWLRAITRFAAHTSGGPNFAYDLCVDKISDEEKEGLDLRSWRVACNGAEPVRPETLERFGAAFEPVGFRRTTFFPSYGLAEGTLLVSGGRIQEEPRIERFDAAALTTGQAIRLGPDDTSSGTPPGRRLVSCGRPASNLTVRVVDPDARQILDDGRIGEIWVNGPSVGQGYWSLPADTRETFHAQLAFPNGHPAPHFLRTGDLGFFQDGELFIAGRRKDLIIIGGRNHAPQDIEATVASADPELNPHSGAAFTIDDGEQEKLILVQEVLRPRRIDAQPLLSRIVRTVAEEHQLTVHQVLLIKRGSIPKTSSGKIQRRLCQERFLNGTLPIVAEWRSSADIPSETTHGANFSEGNGFQTETERRLGAIWSEVFNQAITDPDASFLHLGGDSLKGATIVGRIEESFDVALGLSAVFTCPTLRELAVAIDTAVAIGTRVKEADAGITSTSTEAGNETGELPLSSMQQRVWAQAMRFSGTPLHNLSGGVTLTGAVDADRLRSALLALINRHESLRTVYRTRAGAPYAVILPPLHHTTSYSTLMDRAAGDADEEIFQVVDVSQGASDWRELAVAEARRPFEIDGPHPLLRGRLYRLAEGKNVLQLTLHHLNVDGHSIGILAREWMMLAHADGHGNGLVDEKLLLGGPPLQYREFVHNKHSVRPKHSPDRPSTGNGSSALSDVLPIRWPEPDQHPHHDSLSLNEATSESVAVDISTSTLTQLEALGRRNGKTLFAVLLSAWGVVLQRFLNQSDFMVGVPVAGRHHPGLSTLVGLVMNVLPVRLRLDDDPTFEELLARTQRTLLDVLDHPPEALNDLSGTTSRSPWKGRDALTSTSSLERNPMQTLFVLQEAFPSLMGNGSLGGSGVQSIEEHPSETFEEFDTGMTQVDLTHHLRPTANGLRGWIRYRTAVLSRQSAEAMAESFQQVLEALAGQSTVSVSRLPSFAPSRERLLLDWGAAIERYETSAVREIIQVNDDSTIPDLVSRQAEQTPDALAVVSDAGTLTYRQWEIQANQWARWLSEQQGIQPGMPVIIHAQRRLSLLPAILGIMKAGGVYCPLDPGTPAKRLRAIQENLSQLNSGMIPLVLTDRTDDVDARCLDLDDVQTAVDEVDPATFGCRCRPELLGYVIHTSGSTGRPQGVMVPHRNLVDTLHWRQREFPLTARDRLLQQMSLGFDPSLADLFSPAFGGAALVLAPPAAERDPTRLVERIHQDRISVLQLVPAQLNLLLDVPGFADCTSLRLVLCGGEPLPGNLVRKFHQNRPRQAELVNMYGPTETTIDASFFRCPSELTGDDVPIGRPVAGRRLYVVDETGRLCPPGVTGELWIGGDFLATGYLGDPQRTAARFIADPFDHHPQMRVFRTGDRVVWRSDGTLAYRGRHDRLVKIHGVRTELGEIEAVLREHPRVAEAAVLFENGHLSDEGRKRPRTPGDLLTACLVPRENLVVDFQELADFARRHLPEVMVPRRWHSVSDFPRTSNGKLDHRRLSLIVANGHANGPMSNGNDDAPRLLDSSRDQRTAIPLEGRTPLERWLLDVSRELLGEDRFGIEDSFFAAGGDSIRAAVLTNRIQEKLQEYVYAIAIFDAPTVAGLAAYLEREYPVAVAEKFGQAVLSGRLESNGTLTAADLSEFQGKVRTLPPRESGINGTAAHKAGRNRQAIFLLSAPRSGSTLTRVLFGGHPRLFAPPELQLLNFNTLAERRALLDTARDRFWLEGAIQALARARDWDADRARRQIDNWERDGLSVKQFYAELQQALGDIRLVDKTPMYALDPATLRRAEEDFENTLYVHLIRHPADVMASFEKAHLQVFYPPFLNDFDEQARSPRQLAELVWLTSHLNILSFLESTPAERQYRVMFEDLVQSPEIQLRQVAHWLGLEFDPQMLNPQGDRRRRMTDTLHPLARMLGDVRFHEHKGIEANAAHRWRQGGEAVVLSPATLELAENLGYPVDALSPAAVDRASRKVDTGNWALTRRPRPVPKRLPLSHPQQRLWFFDQLVPRNAFYNIAGAVRIRGPLDREVLERALMEVIRRHQSLRTRFVQEQGEPWQVIEPRVTFQLAFDDLSAGSPANNEDERRQTRDQGEADSLNPRLWSLDASLKKRLLAEALEPFDLTRAPLMRGNLYRLADDEHILSMAMHHIVFDGWSAGVLLREVGLLYEAFAGGKPSPLPELTIEYSDFTQWQREHLEGEVKQRHLDYWRGELQDLPTLALPTDRPRPAKQTFRGELVWFEFPDDLTQLLRQRAGEWNVTPFMVILAVYQLLLSKYTGQDDIVVGSGIANRTRAELESIIGFFVNMLVLRTDLSGDPTFEELLQRVAAICRGAYQHQDMPFEELVQELQPQRDLSREPLFQTAIVMQPDPFAARSTANFTIEPLPIDAGIARYDLTLALKESRRKISAFFEFNTDLFDRATIERMIQHFEQLARVCLASPQRSVSTHSMLPEEERQQLTNDWSGISHDPTPLSNMTTTANGADRLDELWKGQVDRTPDAAAVVDGDKEFSYAELNARVDRWADRLRAAGIGPERIVALVTRKGIDTVAAQLGILQAGGAFLNLDHRDPPDRVRRLLARAFPTLVLADSHCAALLTDLPLEPLADSSPSENLSLYRWTDERFAVGPSAKADSAVTETDPSEQLAYVIYTSGSTGEPKAVQLTHRGACRLAAAQRELFHIRPGDRVLQFAPLNFDASVWEMLMALGSGGTLVIPGPEPILPGPDLEEVIQRFGVTHVTLPPSVLSQLESSACPGLRCVVSAGERCPPAVAARWRDRQFFNAYGPTETTVCATAWSAADDELLATHTITPAAAVPIGRPLPGTSVYVLDQHRQPVPIGVPGELYVGGEQVARGYLHQPQLTAERFIPNPFLDGHIDDETVRHRHVRLYRTGDIVRWTAEGKLVFLGRRDDQHKIRGHRIECGEVQAALEAHPAVREAVVIARADGSGDLSLRAYVSLTANSAAENDQQRIVAGWKDLYEELYATAERPTDDSLDMIGWNDSTTGEKLPEKAMRDWVDNTAARIRKLLASSSGAPLEPGPSILEIGCGTGMIAARVAPVCSDYLATDLSAAALERARRSLTGLQQVRFEQRVANDFSGLEPETFDLVILNSVIQYFSDADYLMEVLRGAISLVKPGGAVFIGDVRRLALQEPFYTQVELARISSNETCMELRDRIARRRQREKELLVDERFFALLQQVDSRITHVAHALKRGPHVNELTQFRYDVVLHIDLGAAVVPAVALSPVTQYRNVATPSDLEVVREFLQRTESMEVILPDVVNSRVSCAVRAHQLLQEAEETLTVRELLDQVSPLETTGLDPDLFDALNDETWETYVRWGTNAEAPERMEIVCRRRGFEPPPSSTYEKTTGSVMPLDWSEAVFAPARQPDASAEFVAELNAFLVARLPEVMRPSSIMVLDAIPRTRRGKVDQEALPSGVGVRPEAAGIWVAPRDEVERELAVMCAELLEIDRVGVVDNFFTLGGHSMLALRLIARIENRWGQRLPVSTFFQNATVEHLADCLKSHRIPTSELVVPLTRPVSTRDRGQPTETRTPDSDGKESAVLNAQCSRGIPPLGSTLPDDESPGGGTPLFLFHPVGGTVFCYWELAREFEAIRPVYGVQAQGLDGERPIHRDVPSLVRAYIEAIQRVQPSGPYALAGWSLGGNIAYAVAVALRQQGAAVEQLSIIDSGVSRAEVGRDEEFMREMMGRLFPDAGPEVWERTRDMTRKEQIELFRQQAESVLILSPGMDQKLVNQAFRIFRYNLKAFSEYVPTPFDGTIDLYLSREQSSERMDAMRQAWSELALGGLNCDVIDGRHLQLMQRPYVTQLAREMIRVHRNRHPSAPILGTEQPVS